MRKLLLLFLIFYTHGVFAQEDIEFKEYSFTEFFQMIEDETDSIFEMKNALILLDTITDRDFISEKNIGAESWRPIRTDTIHIRKALTLENVFIDGLAFGNRAYLGTMSHMVFHEPVTLKNVVGDFNNSRFQKPTEIEFDDHMEDLDMAFYRRIYWLALDLSQNTFEEGLRILSSSTSKKQITTQLFVDSCVIKSRKEDIGDFIITSYLANLSFKGNKFEGEGKLSVYTVNNEDVTFQGNDFSRKTINLNLDNGQNDQLDFIENTFKSVVQLSLSESIQNIRIDWDQFSNGVLNYSSFSDFIYATYGEVSGSEFWELAANPELLTKYSNTERITNNTYYKSEISLLGTLNAIYKRQHDTQSANAVYIMLKDLETQRLEHIYHVAPTFDTFFEWKVNQFLKVFSAYGTRPAKAITFSVYVVLVFALIYLFFPNHWDSHGKDRILHRYHFFFKYLNKDAGMHEVYLEGKEDELAHYEGFKNFFIDNGKTVPKFFLATALPLYRWSIASTRSTSWLLEKVDIFKGKWADLPPAQRAAKTVLLTLIFLLALAYDIFIKMLNALMLSINTFTTLGFGEIPIKGLPRYLAIVQGFIGWFMLTIFSVSLISQLLN